MSYKLQRSVTNCNGKAILVQKLVIRFCEIQSFSGQFKPCNTENDRLHSIRIYHAGAVGSSRTLSLLDAMIGTGLL